MELLRQLKSSGKVTTLNRGHSLYILANADDVPRLYSFIVHEGKPMVTQITEEDVIKRILEG